MSNYLIRLDDACPTMDAKKWQRIEELLDTYHVRPMVGIIPYNEDPKQQIDILDTNFWEKVKEWERKGYAIALHGYNHCYISDKGLEGLNPLWKRSEFSGVSLEEQKEKIRKGVEIFRTHGIEPQYFFAPSHTFDYNTLHALKEESNIRIISDTIATHPYKIGEFTIIPQLGGHCTEIKIPGIWTFCLHPSMMKEENFIQTENFLKKHKADFVGFEDLELNKYDRKSVFSRLLSFVYFTQRKLRGIK